MHVGGRGKKNEQYVSNCMQFVCRARVLARVDIAAENGRERRRNAVAMTMGGWSVELLSRLSGQAAFEIQPTLVR